VIDLPFQPFLATRATLKIAARLYNACRFRGMRLPAVDLSVRNTVGDYEIVALLGRGGMGRVFKVRNLISDRLEAMKSLLSYADAEPELAERFAREIKVLAKLEHPNQQQDRIEL